jgi:hypothetical protein
VELQAAYSERAGDLAAARRCWEEHLLFQPDDAEGYVGLGDWLVRHGQAADAEQVYARALEAFPENFAAGNSPERLAGAAALLARKLADLRIRAWVPASAADEVTRLNQLYLAYDAARDHLWDLKGRLTGGGELGGEVNRGLAAGLAAVIEELRGERETLREGETQARLERVHLAAEAVLLAQFRATTATLERTWKSAAGALRAALKAISESVREELRRATAAGSEEELAEIGETLAQAWQRALERHLPGVALEEATEGDRETVQASLGCLFDALPADEQRYLVFAERIARDPELALFAASAYGLTLEGELGTHVFRPLKQGWIEALLEQRASAPEFEDADDSHEAPLGRYLTGTYKNLTLGQMVLAFSKSILGESGRHRPVFAEVYRWVGVALPQPAVLLELPAAAGERHRRRLGEVVTVRNQSAHPGGGAVSAEAVARCRAALLGEDGFLKLFLAARTTVSVVGS